MKAATTSTEVLGRVIARYRRERDASQAEFGSKLGLSQSAYSRLERGETWVTFPQLGEVAALLQVGVTDLVATVEAVTAALAEQGISVVWSSQTRRCDGHQIWIAEEVIDRAVESVCRPGWKRPIKTAKS